MKTSRNAQASKIILYGINGKHPPAMVYHAAFIRGCPAAWNKIAICCLAFSLFNLAKSPPAG